MSMSDTIPRNAGLGETATGLALPFGILMLVAMMVLPLPAFLLDLFFTVNILISLLILMVALHTFRPLDFSSFPSLLLVATVLRLALNVASTRIVLSSGHTGTEAAGKVIEAFGAFVIAGNFVVGIFVFAIIVIINLVVITKGAGRVSEVSARFTLDAMPGKQMAIDSDLNAGVLTAEEATMRREDVGREADFHGAMDGASKFVKGDAVAGILILAINVIGGLAIGTLQHDLSVGQAAQLYVLLSIGDGLVAQIPSLLLSIATAIIVTRVSSSQDMAQHIKGEISMSRAWFPVAGVLGLIGLVPGMPTMLFTGMAVISGVAGYVFRQTEMRENTDEIKQNKAPEEPSDPDSLTVDDVADLSAVTMLLSYPLLTMVDADDGGPLARRITSVRKQVSQALGFVLPGVRVRDDLALPANAYQIKVGQTVVAENKIYPDHKLAIQGANSRIKVVGMDVKDPSFGIEATWIKPERELEAEANDYVVIEPETVLATHLSQVLYKHASELIGQDDVQELLDNLTGVAPQLVQSVIPKLLPLHSLTAILRHVLRERIPISDLRLILELLSEMAARNLSIAETAEALRPNLVGLLIQQSTPLNEPLPVVTLESSLEHLLINSAKQSEGDQLLLDGALAERLVQSLVDLNEEQTEAGKKTFLIVSPLIRRKLSTFLRQHIADFPVLSFTELPDGRQVDIIASVSGEENAPTQ
ncbi:MAG: flagellar biosynthesis protein FlhA [Planktotalea sp.]|jgi:flagellar biosynthesis protein FlhA|uniref:flagellar biosynthesis protein FlhA n=1 Tax=Planktotalea sp. TaxID=2029877 RepID=UPI0001839F96|nr:flagellar biosynthesis protein FlhA [Planktotalea sp.]EDZ42473.1 flagellar biosynthesis protein FlhA [Rhodobacteraceae bacterium HTCC2083]MDG1078427.1 flagellar biosynthesis protein FlhA [Planktotalea sp.]MDG1085148.1 flagellar biosynthesis protein FlhA [Planktotalea sp.]HCW84129.1 flagellar biosynthesis protein FlhA [Paracoccaceae bacterium]